MKEDKELREKLNSVFEKPETPFEEWAEKRCVLNGGLESVKCSLNIPADNVSGRGIFNGNRKKAVIIGSCVLALLLVAIILMCVFIRPSSDTFVPDIFGEEDTVSVDIQLDEITSNEDIYMFELSGVVFIDFIKKYTLISDSSQIMLYTLNDCLLSVENGEGYDGFYIKYRIRVYDYYEFIGYPKFEDLEKEVTVNNFNVQYSISESTVINGYARFKVGDYEYFIEARGYEGATVVDEDNFINLLNKILI